MKKLIFTLLLSTYLTTIQAQKQFEGMWVCDESSCITTILSSEHKIVKVFSTSFEEHLVLKEKIISESPDSFVTSIRNRSNGWRVRMEYKYIDTDTLSCEFTGDYVGKIIMTRLKTNNF